MIRIIKPAFKFCLLLIAILIVTNFSIHHAIAEVTKTKKVLKKELKNPTKKIAAKSTPSVSSIKAEGNVHVKGVATDTPSSISTKKPSTLKESVAGDSASNNLPILIKSDSLNLDSQGRKFTYRSNVEITKGDLLITADLVNGSYDEGGQIEKIICEKNVVITRGETLRATSNRADYDVKGSKIVLTEGPEINDKGNILDADKVTIFVDEDRSKAEGNVRVKVIRSDSGAVIGAKQK
jgi:lipopolysaccharide transport protein LptA